MLTGAETRVCSCGLAITSLFFLSVFIFWLADVQHPPEIFATLLPALKVSAPVKHLCDMFCAPRCQRPEAGPSKRCRGLTGRCRLSLSGCRSATPGSDTGPHRSPPRWRRWLQASPLLCQALEEILTQIAGLPAEIKDQGVGCNTWMSSHGGKWKAVAAHQHSDKKVFSSSPFLKETGNVVLSSLSRKIWGVFFRAEEKRGVLTCKQATR